jgi:hypothetical protein
MGAEIQRIYQQIAVEFQTARANQVYITRNSFVLPHPPPQPRGPCTPRYLPNPTHTMNTSVQQNHPLSGD